MSKLTKGIHCGSAGAKRRHVQAGGGQQGGPIRGVLRNRCFFDLRRHGAELDQPALRIQTQANHSNMDRRRVGWGSNGNGEVDEVVHRRSLEILRALAIPEIDQGRLAFRQLRPIGGGLLLLLRVELVVRGVTKTVGAIGGRLGVPEALDHVLRPLFQNGRRLRERRICEQTRPAAQHYRRNQSGEDERRANADGADRDAIRVPRCRHHLGRRRLSGGQRRGQRVATR